MRTLGQYFAVIDIVVSAMWADVEVHIRVSTVFPDAILIEYDDGETVFTYVHPDGTVSNTMV